MKVSRTWLQKYFDAPLPTVEVLSDAFTFHAFEVEEIKGDMIDLKVLPDRACYALSHRGIAKELSAILEIPLSADPLTAPLPSWPETKKLSITTDADYVLRHIGALITGVTVGPSPLWLKNALESVGQRSINNVVDATNYVMNNIGQPMHAFDADAIAQKDGVLHIDIRQAHEGEKVQILSGEEYTMTGKMYVIADGTTGEALDIAGLKGGKASGTTEKTKNLFISCGTYDGTLIRKMAQSLKLFTDASTRYQNKPSPELTAYGMRDVIALIQEIAGGELIGVVDIYNRKQDLHSVSVTSEYISKILGRTYSDAEVSSVFTRLGFQFENANGVFVVTPPFERGDIQIPEDLVEEVGRIIGYDTLESQLLTADTEVDQKKFRSIEKIKDYLTERGYTEISTQSFAKAGDIQLANPLDDSHPFLRTTLTKNMQSALTLGKNNLPLVLPPKVPLKLFEIGNIFTKDEEKLSLVLSDILPELDHELGVKGIVTDGISEYDLSKMNLESYGSGYVSKRYTLTPFASYSPYPFVLRDIAVWTPNGTTVDEARSVIEKNAGPLLYRCDLFDTYTKDDATSYAFRLVFQSKEKTLTDAEVTERMDSVVGALHETSGWKVR